MLTAGRGNWATPPVGLRIAAATLSEQSATQFARSFLALVMSSGAETSHPILLHGNGERFLDFARNDRMALGMADVTLAEDGIGRCINVSSHALNSACCEVYSNPTAPRTRVMTSSATSLARRAPRARTLSTYNLSARSSSRRFRIGEKYSQSFSNSCFLNSP